MNFFHLNIKDDYEILSATRIKRDISMHPHRTISYCPDYHLLQYFVDVDRQVQIDNEIYALSKDSIMLSYQDIPYLAPPPKKTTIALNIAFKNISSDLWRSKKALNLDLPFITDAKTNPLVQYMFEQIILLHNQSQNLASFKAQILFKQLLLTINDFPLVHDSSNHMDKAIHYIHKNNHINITVEHLLNLTGLPRSSFDRNFKLKTGKSPNQYITDYKISCACQILQIAPDTKISRLSEELGYCDPYYFSNVFKKQVGISPKDFRILQGTKIKIP